MAMGTGPRWSITFRGCAASGRDCDAALFEATSGEGDVATIEVRTTAQVEHILARELGKGELMAEDREAILSVAGRRLIEEQLANVGAVEPLLFLDSRLFRVPGEERRLLRECGLLAGADRP